MPTEGRATATKNGAAEKEGAAAREGVAPEEKGKAVQVTDLAGRTVEFTAPAEKVVAIGPGALRFVCYVNGADKVVGVEELEKNNPGGRPYFTANADLLVSLPTIGQGGPQTQPDAEQLINIKPDVIFSLLTDKAESDKLQAKTGIPVVVLAYGTLSTFSKEIYDSVMVVGKVIGEEERAREVLAYLDECKNDMHDRTKNIPEDVKPTVYIGGLGAAGIHGIDSTQGKYPPFEVINARNVVDETGQSGSIMVDREKIVSWDPDIIFIDSSAYQLVVDDYKKDPKYYTSLSAVKNGRLYSMISYNWYWTNIETAVADAYYAGKVIFPEKFEDIDPVQKADEIYELMLGKKLYAEMAKDFIGFKQLTLE